MNNHDIKDYPNNNDEPLESDRLNEFVGILKSELDSIGKNLFLI